MRWCLCLKSTNRLSVQKVNPLSTNGHYSGHLAKLRFCGIGIFNSCTFSTLILKNLHHLFVFISYFRTIRCFLDHVWVNVLESINAYNIISSFQLSWAWKSGYNGLNDKSFGLAAGTNVETWHNGPFSSGGQKWALTGVIHGNMHVIVLSCTHLQKNMYVSM